MSDYVLTVENVVKSFGKFRALDGASLAIPKGCIFGIIGPNGAGKSTLLRIVTSLAHPDSGRVTVNGIDVEAYPKKALKGTAMSQFFTSGSQSIGVSASTSVLPMNTQD